MLNEISLSDLTTGNATVDNLHQDFLNGLQHLKNVPNDNFESQFRIFVQATEKTFGIEEAWMEKLDCALIQSHREQHARVLSALHHVHARLMQGDIALGRQVIGSLLPQWFAFHATTMDAVLAAALECMDANVTVIDGTKNLTLTHPE